MKLQVFVIVLLYSSAFSSCMNETESYLTPRLRKKRVLGYPVRSFLALTTSLLKVTPFQATVNTLHEIDVLFPLPKNVWSVVFFHHERSISDRLLIYEQLQNMGLDGYSCIERLRCESKFLSQKFLKKGFVLKMIHTIFTIPSEIKHGDIKSCNLFNCRSFFPNYFLS